MDPTKFAEECRRLARPRLNPRRRTEVVGGWGGAGPLTPTPGEWRHWITVSRDWLSRNGFAVAGSLAVYENTDEDHFHEFVAAVGEPADGRLEGAGGVELVGTEDVALPPVDALLQDGGAATGEMTRRGNQANLLATDEEGCPLFYADAEGIYAALGGWPTTWPDTPTGGEPGRLVMWTFADSEPYLEVWQRPEGQLQVVPRIT